MKEHLMKSDIAMKRIPAYIMCFVVAFLSACSKTPDLHSDDALITVCASVTDTDVATRAASEAKPYRGTIPTEDNPLEAKMLFSTEEGAFRHSPVSPTWLPCHSKVTFTDDSYKYPEKYNGFNLKYPTDNSTVYCVGMTPADDLWQISSDGKTAEHPIDGSDDIMYAECLEGSWNRHFEPHHFKHQLTWIKFCVYATETDAGSFWGNIESLSIESKESIIISLEDGKVTFSENKREIPSFEGSHQLTTTLHELGSVFCSPSLEYRITVKTAKCEERSITVKLTDEKRSPLLDPADAAGRLYVIELGFTPFAIIEGECVLNPWEYQDENLYLK